MRIFKHANLVFFLFLFSRNFPFSSYLETYKVRAKALYTRFINNHGLKAVVIENELIMDFSP